MTTEQAESRVDTNNSLKQKPNLEKTYTESDIQKMRSDLLSEVGQHKASSERAMKSAQAALDKLTKWEQEQQEAELETYKDDPAELRRIRAEQGKKKAVDELATVKLELSEKSELLNGLERERAEVTKTQTAREIAARLNVDPDKLIKFAKLTDGTLEAIEEIAKDLPKITTPAPKLKPDSNKSSGGNLTDEAIVANYIKDPYNKTNKELYSELRARR